LPELFRTFTDFFPDNILEGRVPVAQRCPLLTVPFGNTTKAAALVVFFSKGCRRNQALSIKVADTLHTLTQLVAGQRSAELFQRNASALNVNGHGGDTDVVVGAAYVLARSGALARLNDFFDDVLNDGGVSTTDGRLELAYALGHVTSNGVHVGFGQPHNRVDLLGFDAVADGITDRHGLAAARAPDNDEVRTVTANIRPCGGLFVTRAGVGEGSEFEVQAL